MKTLLFFIVTCFLTTVVFAQEENYAICGKETGLLARLLTDAEDIRMKCIQQVNEENKRRAQVELDRLVNLQKLADDEIRKTAVSHNISMVNCGGGKRDPKLVERCKKAVQTKAAVIDRIDRIMGWKRLTTSAPKKNSSQNSSAPDPAQYPCPNEAELQRMQVARAFDKRINEMWTRCTIDGY